MWKYIKPFRIQALTGFIFKIIEAFFELLVPIVVASIIDDGIALNDRHYVIKMGIVLIVFAIVGYCCALVCQYFASKTSQAFGTYLRNDLYKKINALDFSQLDEIGSSSLITRMTNDINQLELAVAMIIRLVSRSPFIIIGSFFMAFRIDAKLSIVFLMTAPVLAFIIYYFMSRTIPMYVKIQKQLDAISLICRENLSGMRVIRAFCKQEEEKKRFHDSVNRQKDMQIGTSQLASLLNPMTSVVVNMGILVILYVGALRVQGGFVLQGDVVALIHYLNQILLSMIVFANVIVILNKAAASYQRVCDVLNLEPEIVDGYSESSDLDDSIVFDHVGFHYAHSHVLSDVSFSIAKGETVGIIGGTGCGKTTLMHLLMRFYDVSEGKIMFHGRELCDYPLAWLHQKISLVFQDVSLLKGTIRENLCLGKKDISDECLWQALDIAQGQFVKELEQGLDSEIVQDGKNLSGGQRQRLTIARSLVQNPEVLILDDSMSALDFATEAALRKALMSMDMTKIIVSQRLSSLKHADKIIVLSHGEVVGIGSHRDLMESCQIYQEIAASQMVEEDDYE